MCGNERAVCLSEMAHVGSVRSMDRSDILYGSMKAGRRTNDLSTDKESVTMTSLHEHRMRDSQRDGSAFQQTKSE
jgi:hypothetical protein